MGCAGAMTSLHDGKSPDTTETMMYFALFALWIVFLIHAKKTLGGEGPQNTSPPR